MYAFLTFSWLLAYIESPTLQKFYYRAIVWITPITWIFHFWTTFAFIRSGLEEGGTLWKGFVYAISTDAGLLLFQTFAWLCAPAATKYYRWSEQSWWTYESSRDVDTQFWDQADQTETTVSSFDF